MGSTGGPARRAATTVRGPGMIQKNTLALMAVAIMAPTSRKAARPANRWHASHAAKATNTATKAPTRASPLSPSPNQRQIASYNTQNTTKNDRAAVMAAAGFQSITLGSIK